MDIFAANTPENHVELVLIVEVLMVRKTPRKRKFRVLIIESERGWGQRVDEIKEFKTLIAARKFVKEYNEEYNNKSNVPDWYMIAKLENGYED